MVLFYGVIAQTVTDRPNYFPDFLRGVLPLASYAVWVCMQRVALRNRVRIDTLMTLIRRDEIFRKADSLPQGLEKGQPLNWPYVVFEALMFVLMGLALYGAVEPFLSVKPGIEPAFRAFNALLGFVVSAGTWQYVKQSNRASGKALVLIARGL